MDDDQRRLVANARLTVYVCEGTPAEIQEWFETINIAGVPLTRQELRNAAYHGPFVTRARGVFSNTANANMARWQAYVRGDPKRQAILEAALDWASGGHIDDYMARHRQDRDIDGLTDRFDAVVDWADSVFEYVGDEMRGLEWGRLYDEYHGNAYSRGEVAARVGELLADPQVTDKRGVFEYVLGGEVDTRLLNVRVFDKRTLTLPMPKGRGFLLLRGSPSAALAASGLTPTPQAF